MLSQKNFGSTKILSKKKNLVLKDFGSKKSLSPTKFCAKKNFRSKKIVGQKNVGSKKILVRKNFRPVKINLGPAMIWANVARTNVTWSVGISSRCSHEPTFKVWSKSCQ